MQHPSKPIHLFTVSPRASDPRTYWANIEQVIDLSERHGYSGMLIFTGNDTFVEPWAAAQRLIERTRHLIPLVAVNPVYMHPFTVAKLISSFAYLYGRKTYLNMVTGAALSYQKSLGDPIDHGARYDRLGEYLSIVKGLLTQPRLSHQGRTYQLANLQLLPRVPADLMPGFLLSGQSDAALQVARASEAVSMQMLPGTLESGVRAGVGGIHFGVVTRPTEDEAWRAARRLFPEDIEGQAMLELSMANTDSQWKQRMKLAAEQGQGAHPGYWLEPFRNFKADCPYFVGSHAQVAGLMTRLVAAGIDTIILDLPPVEEEFEQVRVAFAGTGLTIERATAAPARIARTTGGQAQPGTPAALTALFAAVAREQLELVHEMLAHTPALARAADADGITALMVAAQNDSPGAARALIEHGADLEAIDRMHWSTALGWAAFFGNQRAAACLVAAGASTAYVNIYGLTAREIALGGARGEHAAEAPDRTAEDFLAIAALMP